MIVIMYMSPMCILHTEWFRRILLDTMLPMCLFINKNRNSFCIVI